MDAITRLAEALKFLNEEVRANLIELKAQNKRIENLEYELEMVKSELSRMVRVRQ